MFSKQLDRINGLLISAQKDSLNSVDSIGLISSNISRPRVKTLRTETGHESFQSRGRVLSKEGVPKEFSKILQQLFQAKCSGLKIQFNEHNWQTFVKAFLSKNKLAGNNIKESRLDLNDFYLNENCLPVLNTLLVDNPHITTLALNKNYFDLVGLARIETIKELSLRNCKLGNDALEKLFMRLVESAIEKISLSSPELKDRNQLTRYTRLIELIQQSSTLHTLELSNIEIRPDSQILESARGTSLKHIDLSDNGNVSGICPTILSLNLSHNGITSPFSFPMTSNELEYLNISSNKIPYYHFKEFLKITYFSSLKCLILDHIRLDGDLSAIQFYLQQSLSLIHLSMIDCDFSQVSYCNIADGIRHSRSLESVDLSRNRVMNLKVAQSLSLMFQGCLLRWIRMRHCDINDQLGSIILKQIHKNKQTEKLDLMNNLLGDESAKTICNELKYARNITTLLIEQNIIKHKDMQEIQSYLQGNRYITIAHLDKEYQKLKIIDQQLQEAGFAITSEGQRLAKLEKETIELHGSYVSKFKQENSVKKNKIIGEIHKIRAQQNQLLSEIMMRQSLLSMSDLGSRKESLLNQSQVSSEYS